ncbi:glutamate receptor ionotropic, kainate 2 isoform X1 [Lepeophtheirus salmonis]
MNQNFAVLFLLIVRIQGLPDIIKIGGLFDITDSKQEVAFRYAVERVNQNRKILPNSILSAQIEKIPPQDSFHASKQVCHLLRTGVAALFGPQSGTTSSHVQSICDAMEIPHIETRWDYRLKNDAYSVNLYPHPKTISKAYVDLIESFGWMSYTILYEDNQGLMRLQELLKSPINSDVKISVRQLPINDDYRALLKEVKKTGEVHIILDCSFEKIQTILKQALQIGMMTPYHNYLITSFDLHMVNLEEFKYGGTNLTAYRLLDPNRIEIRKVVEDWIFGEMRYGRVSDVTSMGIKTETALMYDAVHLFAQALQDLDRSRSIDTKSISCNGVETWQHGSSLVNYMKLVEMNGLTGKIIFDQHGLRTDFVLEVIELKKDGLVKVGTWNDNTGVNFTRNFTESYTEIVESLQNKTLVVTTIYSPPYSMYRDSSKRLTGNDVFEGYAIDLIAEVAEILKFNYTFKWVDDQKYGKRNKETGEWNGMMGELLAQKADLAIADLTITYEREQAVDFTMPYMNLGVSILYKKPTRKPPNLFSFLSPLSLDVWIYMATAYLGVSVLLFILARFSPYEWDNPHPCADEPDVLVNEFSLVNSMWFTIGSLMQQGSDLAPKAISTRMVAGMWWFFTLIMISSYTANLAAFLTVERMESPIESAEDLSKQTKIKYGCVESGSTGAFFRDSKIPTYQRMWSFMESTKPVVFTKGNPEGIERVKKENGNYAFLMESTTIEYVVERECDTTQIGGLLDSKSYGIALPPGSPYRMPISSAILKLQEGGRLHLLKRRWFSEERGGGVCKKDDDRAQANELSLANVGGVFVVLLAGMGIACLVAVFEFIWKSRKLANEENVRNNKMDVWSEMVREVRSSFGSGRVKNVNSRHGSLTNNGNPIKTTTDTYNHEHEDEETAFYQVRRGSTRSGGFKASSDVDPYGPMSGSFISNNNRPQSTPCALHESLPNTGSSFGRRVGSKTFHIKTNGS